MSSEKSDSIRRTRSRVSAQKVACSAFRNVRGKNTYTPQTRIGGYRGCNAVQHVTDARSMTHRAPRNATVCCSRTRCAYNTRHCDNPVTTPVVQRVTKLSTGSRRCGNVRASPSRTRGRSLIASRSHTPKNLRAPRPKTDARAITNPGRDARNDGRDWSWVDDAGDDWGRACRRPLRAKPLGPPVDRKRMLQSSVHERRDDSRPERIRTAPRKTPDDETDCDPQCTTANGRKYSAGRRSEPTRCPSHAFAPQRHGPLKQASHPHTTAK